MLSKYTAVVFGLEGFCVEVETSISNGLPYCTIVGLDASVNNQGKGESAIKNSNGISQAE